MDASAIRSWTLGVFRGRFRTCIAGRTHVVPLTQNYVGRVIGNTNENPKLKRGVTVEDDRAVFLRSCRS